jgi:hypothetical protein
MSAGCSPFLKRKYSMVRGGCSFLAGQLSYICILYILPVDYVEDHKDTLELEPSPLKKDIEI